MAMTYEEATRRLGRRAVVQIDKRRGTEFRRAPGEAGMRGDIQVRYRGTPVVTFHPNHTYTLRTGGMASKTVIKRIAEYSPISLVRRGNGFFIENVNTRRLIPFLEGQTVDQVGNIVEETEDGMAIAVTNTRRDDSLPSIPAATALPSQMLDEAKLRAYIKRTVLEVMGNAVMPPAAQTRPVHVTSVAREVPAVAVAGAPQNHGATELLELLLSGKIDADKARRRLKELQNAMKRGRDQADDIADAVSDADLDAAVAHGAMCGECKEPTMMHFDKANRYRGCDYALDHRGEKAELIR